VHTQSLDGDQWTVRAVGDLAAVPEHIRGRVFPARVPGCVHLDLIRAGVLRHPNLGYAERDQEWVGRTDWRYERRFVVEPGSPTPRGVSFECLDTVAAVQFNGQQIGSAANFHMSHAFNALPAVREGENLLTVTLRAPVPFVERAHAEHARLPYNGDFLRWAPFNMLRKPACNFGWDWGPRVATSGIAGSVTLQIGHRARGACGMPVVRRDPAGRWVVEVMTEGLADVPDRQGVELRLIRDGQGISGTTQPPGEVVEGVAKIERHRVVVENPELWWPRGYGERPIYELHCIRRRAGNEFESRWPVWFRTLMLDNSPDDIGSAFTIRVNGRPVFCRGANWIPDALFPTEATPERIRERVRQAADANMNMLRVWGGGLYEQEAFYEACDELGIMVWQDFPYACALYPDELRPSWDGAAMEAGWQMVRLRQHPSIVLWCGGNECVEGYQHWGWKHCTPRHADWGLGIWCRELPRIVARFDPTVPYWPNSPWSGGPLAGEHGPSRVDPEQIADVRDPDHGDRHTWDLHFEDVRKIVPRFVSEFGRIAPACERTLHEAEVFAEAFAEAAPAAWPREAPPWNDATRAALEHRLRQTGGSNVAYDPVLPEHFRRPATDLRSWLWQTQILQCRALTTHIEWLRANAPRCMGALLWQLNDCWACQSWSIIDGAGRPKPAWYAVRRAFEPRLLTIQPLGHGADTPARQGRGLSGPPAEALSIVLINDTDEPAGAPCRVRRVTFGGTELAARELPLGAAPRTNATLPDLAALVGEPDDPSTECLVAEWGAHRAWWFWERDLRLHLPDDPLSAECIRGADGLTLRLRARALAKDIIIAADLLGEHARADDNSFTMLPGETREVHIAGVAACALPVAEFVRCASGPAASCGTDDPPTGAGVRA
jgi:beta-mannosidase